MTSFPHPQQAQREDLAALRRRIVEMERLSGLPDGPARPRLSLGGGLDEVLGGGLARDALHEAFPAEKGNAAAVLGFALALAAGTRKPVLWVRQDMAALEGGDIYGPGCAAFGLDPSRLILVAAADAADTLGAAEEALGHGALGLVVAEPWGSPRLIDLTATRRLALRSERSGVPSLLLRPGADPGPSAAATRWRVAAAPSRVAGDVPAFCLGLPAFALEIERNRLGPTGRFTVEWNAHARRFTPAPRRALPAAPADRPAAPQPAGASHVVSGWRRTG
ncbi:protein ImuA [Xanthobacter sp. SG618]|uniref:ImuA family protein n=1 Tax=Xanthobacter sp. SG618 TaxID=2587121 RepID=UPI00145EAA8C|nr:hypothetical protein [Xanthobacter sp. SG618]NMN58657.1 protein ImuA [Xanthobacter sp. SG618]